jgi:hypothetical protein
VRTAEVTPQADEAQAPPAARAMLGGTIADRLLTLQRTAGNRAVQRMVKQRAAQATLQRDPLDENVCDDADFCKPYASAADAASTESWLRWGFLPVMEAKFGTEVHDLWESYLSRKPGDSLAPVVFETAGNPIEESFATSWDTTNDADAVLELVMNRLDLAPMSSLRPHSRTTMSLSNFLSESEMKNRPINYSNPLSKAGNIAGGIGKSAAGKDYRKIIHGNVSMTKTPLIGNSGYIDFELTIRYEVGDAVDFCPGQCGSPAEQQFTIPLSRLEASGEAFDVPFVVRFRPENRTNREFYTSLPL